MNKKNDAQVMILGKPYTLSGFEDDDYLQKLASFINNKNEEVKKLQFYNAMDAQSKHVLLSINLADEYFKSKKRCDEFRSDMDKQNDEISSLRREILEYRSKLEETQKQVALLKEKIVEEQKKAVKLETELAAEKKGKRT